MCRKTENLSSRIQLWSCTDHIEFLYGRKFPHSRHQDELRSFLLKTECIVDLDVEYVFDAVLSSIQCNECERDDVKHINELNLSYFLMAVKEPQHIRSILSVYVFIVTVAVVVEFQ